jgi:hypothetical protein
VCQTYHPRLVDIVCVDRYGAHLYRPTYMERYVDRYGPHLYRPTYLDWYGPHLYRSLDLSDQQRCASIGYYGAPTSELDLKPGEAGLGKPCPLSLVLETCKPTCISAVQMVGMCNQCNRSKNREGGIAPFTLATKLSSQFKWIKDSVRNLFILNSSP